MGVDLSNSGRLEGPGQKWCTYYQKFQFWWIKELHYEKPQKAKKIFKYCLHSGYSRQSNNRVNTERVHLKNFRSTRAYLIVTRTRAACAARAKFFQKGTFYLFWIVLIVIMFEKITYIDWECLEIILILSPIKSFKIALLALLQKKNPLNTFIC